MEDFKEAMVQLPVTSLLLTEDGKTTSPEYRTRYETFQFHVIRFTAEIGISRADDFQKGQPITLTGQCAEEDTSDKRAVDPIWRLYREDSDKFECE